jgi:hypothetical protein
MQTQMPAPRRVFFCFVFFVATKKMKLLSGNPDGFDLAFRSKLLGTKVPQKAQQNIDLLRSSPQRNKIKL